MVRRSAHRSGCGSRRGARPVDRLRGRPPTGGTPPGRGRRRPGSRTRPGRPGRCARRPPGRRRPGARRPPGSAARRTRSTRSSTGSVESRCSRIVRSGPSARSLPVGPASVVMVATGRNNGSVTSGSLASAISGPPVARRMPTVGSSSAGAPRRAGCRRAAAARTRTSSGRGGSGRRRTRLLGPRWRGTVRGRPAPPSGRVVTGAGRAGRRPGSARVGRRRTPPRGGSSVRDADPALGLTTQPLRAGKVRGVASPLVEVAVRLQRLGEREPLQDPVAGRCRRGEPQLRVVEQPHAGVRRSRRGRAARPRSRRRRPPRRPRRRWCTPTAGRTPSPPPRCTGSPRRCWSAPRCCPRGRRRRLCRPGPRATAAPVSPSSSMSRRQLSR